MLINKAEQPQVVRPHEMLIIIVVKSPYAYGRQIRYLVSIDKRIGASRAARTTTWRVYTICWRWLPCAIVNIPMFMPVDLCAGAKFGNWRCLSGNREFSQNGYGRKNVVGNFNGSVYGVVCTGFFFIVCT